MRTREEIEKELKEKMSSGNIIVWKYTEDTKILAEILLDIREILDEHVIKVNQD